jgi:hypothetical protein
MDSFIGNPARPPALFCIRKTRPGHKWFADIWKIGRCRSHPNIRLISCDLFPCWQVSKTSPEAGLLPFNRRRWRSVVVLEATERHIADAIRGIVVYSSPSALRFRRIASRPSCPSCRAGIKCGIVRSDADSSVPNDATHAVVTQRLPAHDAGTIGNRLGMTQMTHVTQSFRPPGREPHRRATIWLFPQHLGQPKLHGIAACIRLMSFRP